MTNRLTKFLSYFLTFILGTAIGAGVYGIADNLPMNNLKDEFISTEQPGGLILSDESESNGIKLVSAAIPAEQFADYGVSPAAESAFVLEATITPADALIQTGIYTMEFENSSSEWANGKECSTYISMQQSGLQAIISCLEAFGERIIVTFKSDDEACDKMATCTLEYEKKITVADIGVHFITAEDISSGTSVSDFSYTRVVESAKMGTATYISSETQYMLVIGPVNSDALFCESVFTKDKEYLKETKITIAATPQMATAMGVSNSCVEYVLPRNALNRVNMLHLMQVFPSQMQKNYLTSSFWSRIENFQRTPTYSSFQITVELTLDGVIKQKRTFKFNIEKAEV